MFRSKIKLILLSVILMFLFTGLTSGSLLLRYLPDNKAGVTLFKAVYNLPFGRETFLEFYSPMRKNEVGYVPVEVTQFLIKRLETTNDEDEISSIVHFYALQASSHRIGYLFNISEEVKTKLIIQLIEEIDDEPNLIGKLMMLEELRTSKRLGKGAVYIEGISQSKFSTAEEYRKWFYDQSASIVVKKYQEWWNSNLSWEEKRKINPLEGTGIKVSECCG